MGLITFDDVKFFMTLGFSRLKVFKGFKLVMFERFIKSKPIGLKAFYG